MKNKAIVTGKANELNISSVRSIYRPDATQTQLHCLPLSKYLQSSKLSVGSLLFDLSESNFPKVISHETCHTYQESRKIKMHVRIDFYARKLIAQYTNIRD